VGRDRSLTASTRRGEVSGTSVALLPALKDAIPDWVPDPGVRRESDMHENKLSKSLGCGWLNACFAGEKSKDEGTHDGSFE
jgi:hypothetical protein